MRTRLRSLTASAAAAAMLGLSPPAVLAQSQPPSTPVPGPVDPDQPPASVPPPPTAPGPIVADAATGVGMLRILPKTVPTDTILDAPGFERTLPKQSVAEFGMGLTVAQANTRAYLAQEKAVAESSPYGMAVGGRAPHLPGALSQTALPDHPEPTVSGMAPPPSPADQFLRLGATSGSVQARWTEQRGPCEQPIADARNSVASVSAVNSLPPLPNPGSAPARLWQQLGGMLNGQPPVTGGGGSLLHVPDTLESHSTVRLVDVPGQHGHAVQSSSTMRVASIRLLAGTPQELRVDVVSQPTLTALSTGDPRSSTVDYRAPVLRVSQGGRELGTLDAAHPSLNIPVDAVPPITPEQIPVIGQRLPHGIDLGVLRMSIGELRHDLVGAEARAGAKLFDLVALPADRLGIPTALTEISFGEQIARAGAPPGGVVCDLSAPAPPPAPAPTRPSGPAPLAMTSGAYYSIPLFWIGAGLLLFGSLLVAALPRRR